MAKDVTMYNTADAAKKVGISVALVKRLAKERGIGRRVGRDWIFADADIEAMRNREDLRRKPQPKQ